MSIRHPWLPLTLLVVLSAGLLGVLAGAHSLADRPAPPKTNGQTCLLSPELPSDISLTETGTLDDRSAFNDFSWQNFIPLNWPAVSDARGKPDRARKFGDKADQVVWGTWKSLAELYPHGHPPTSWDNFDASLVVHQLDKDGKHLRTPIDSLPRKGAGRRRVLSQIARLGKVNEAGFVALPQGPLIAQNGTYVRYELRLNQIAYEFMTDNQYYLPENLPGLKAGPARHFPCGSVLVKAAWMELKPDDARERFYHVPADLVEWTKEGKVELRQAEVGLVGLHIAHKTPSHPSWIWSTFEQVDNTEPGPGAARASFSRNDPTTPNDSGFDYEPQPVTAGTPLPKDPRPVDVLRLERIHSTTQTVNQRYHRLEEVRGTVWQYYRLVATQWVPKPDSGEADLGKELKLLPDGGVANPTLETYTQTSSCVRCHSVGKPSGFNFVFFPSLPGLHSPPKR
jgi:hypothetical protein